MKQGSLAYLNPFLQLLLFFGLVLIGIVLTSLISLFVLSLMHINPMVLGSLNENPGADTLQAVRISSLIQDIFLFIFPSISYAFLCEKPKEDGLMHPRKIVWLSFFLIIPLWFSIIPIVSSIGLWNEKIMLPHFLKNLEDLFKSSEQQLDNIINHMLQVKDVQGLVINLITMALFPAIAEEVFFRGALQKILIKTIRLPHLAIWLGAILFSAIHFQFYGFFPRFILGLVLGYLFYWSGSILPGVLFHFLNNGIQVFLASRDSIYGLKKKEDWLNLPPNFVLVISSILLSGFLLWLIKNQYFKSQQSLVE